jgi:hypothetical protein
VVTSWREPGETGIRVHQKKMKNEQTENLMDTSLREGFWIQSRSAVWKISSKVSHEVRVEHVKLSFFKPSHSNKISDTCSKRRGCRESRSRDVNCETAILIHNLRPFTHIPVNPKTAGPDSVVVVFEIVIAQLQLGTETTKRDACE